jgi:N-acetylglucosamine kinase-like BadF-type ATPase
MTSSVSPEPGVVVGIDAGGTSVRVLVADAYAGEALGEARGPARPDGGPDALGPLVTRAFAGSPASRVAGVRAVCAGITKVSRAGVANAWQAELARLFPDAAATQGAIEIVPDFVIAFAGATGGVGVLIIAGTGSVAYGEDGRGGTVRVGGRGWEYGDEGSGAHLTGDLMRRALRALDGIDAPTPLTDAVCAHLGEVSGDAGAAAERARQRAQQDGRGFLVPLALERARAGDAEAQNLFVGAAGWLAAMVGAVAGRLDFRPVGGGDPAAAPFPVATVGGLWEAGDLIHEPFNRLLRRRLPGAQVIASPRATPVEGAVRRAVARAR